MQYNEQLHGRTSGNNPANPTLANEWGMAARLNDELPADADYRWVPASTVYSDDSISPRKGAYVDQKRVQDYAEIWDQLPPIDVQKDSFKLIDGLHRLTASYLPEANTVLVKVREHDIPDDELREAAYDANVAHGLSLTPDERTAFMRYIMEKHADWTDGEVARRCGVARRTVLRYRQAKIAKGAAQGEERAPARGGEPPLSEDDPAEFTEWPSDAGDVDDGFTTQLDPDDDEPKAPWDASGYEGPVTESHPPAEIAAPDDAIICLANYSMTPDAFWWACSDDRKDEIRAHIDNAITWITELAEVVEGK